VNLEEAAWGGDDDDLDIDDEIMALNSDNAVNIDTTESDIYVPPQPGVDPMLNILRMNPNSAVLHAAHGDFRKAAELLKSQIGLVNL